MQMSFSFDPSLIWFYDTVGYEVNVPPTVRKYQLSMHTITNRCSALGSVGRSYL